MIMNPYMRIFLSLLIYPFTAVTLAETAYITNEIRVGIHADKTVDSPILKLLPSGTVLEIIKREERMSFVQDPTGSSGWLDNTYLIPEKPQSRNILELQTRNRNLEQQLLAANRKIQDREQDGTLKPGSSEASNLAPGNEQLQQELNSERIKNGELQVEMTELRKHIGQNSDNESLFEKILKLEETNRNLQIQLESKQNGNAGRDLPVTLRLGDGNINSVDWRRQLLYLTVALISGLGLGVYLMDYLNRRRHGGFRI